MSLVGKVALITGASSGIGQAIAMVFAERGADIAANGRRRDALARTVAELEKLGRRALALPADVCAPDQVREMVKRAVDCFGRVDILVNNVGRGLDRSIEEMSDDEWKGLLAANLNGTFYCSREVVPIMKAQGGGVIINISSAGALIGRAGRTAYTTAKAGILGFTKALAKELAPCKIRVNAIAPGTTMTPALNRHGPEFFADRLRNIPLGRFGRPEDIAYLAAFLASDEADYITGQVISPNGGSVIVGI